MTILLKLSILYKFQYLLKLRPVSKSVSISYQVVTQYQYQYRKYWQYQYILSISIYIAQLCFQGQKNGQIRQLWDVTRLEKVPDFCDLYNKSGTFSGLVSRDIPKLDDVAIFWAGELWFTTFLLISFETIFLKKFHNPTTHTS